MMLTHPVPNIQGSARILDQDLFRHDNILRFRVVTGIGQSPKPSKLQHSGLE